MFGLSPRAGGTDGGKSERREEAAEFLATLSRSESLQPIAAAAAAAAAPVRNFLRRITIGKSDRQLVGVNNKAASIPRYQTPLRLQFSSQ